ncbi:MAG TPA: SPOR domain-containing protein [Prolixibacteraceae bacterium]|nr:SPOR domain-containing protein [Prolixibacteraceae bacterium]
MRKIVVVFLFLTVVFISLRMQGQSSLHTQISVPQSNTENFTDDHLKIHCDPRVDTLIQIHREENIRKTGIEGYRVQIFQGNKDAAYQAKARFLSTYENMKVYVLFQSPDFKVRVGDFRTKSEALKLRNQLKNEFPSVFIIDDLISLPEIDESKAGL